MSESEHIRTICLAALASTVLAASVAAQTLEQTASEIEALINWSGEAKDKEGTFFSVDMDIDQNCETQVAVKAAAPSGSPPIDLIIAGNLGELDPNRIEFYEFNSVPRLQIDAQMGGSDWKMSSIISADHPMMGAIKERIAEGRLGGTCDAQACAVTDTSAKADIPIIGGAAEADRPRVISLFQKMIALCRG